MPFEVFPDFMFELGTPLGWDETMQFDEEAQDKFIEEMALETYQGGSFGFLNVFENLALLVVVNSEMTKKAEVIPEEKK